MSEGARREKRKLKLNVEEFEILTAVDLSSTIAVFMLLHENALVIRLFNRPFQ